MEKIVIFVIRNAILSVVMLFVIGNAVMDALNARMYVLGVVIVVKNVKINV